MDTSANAATKEHRYYHIWPVQASAMAAKLMHNVELAGKQVTQETHHTILPALMKRVFGKRPL